MGFVNNDYTVVKCLGLFRVVFGNQGFHTSSVETVVVNKVVARINQVFYLGINALTSIEGQSIVV